MIRFFSILAFLFSGFYSLTAQYTIVPQPAHIKYEKGFFVLNENTRIITYGKNTDQLAIQLQTYLNTYHGLSLTIKKGKAHLDKNAIILLAEEEATSFNSDKYTLSVKPHHIMLDGEGNSGRVYALQTFYQLLPPIGKSAFFQLPCVEIEDSSRFSYRGMHLDVSRHFFSIDYVKKFINLLALHKFNTFHWHLTDDQGWRLQLDKYPRLTQIGSGRNGTLIGKLGPNPAFDQTPVSGFYTVKEMHEVVQFAAERGIEVIPEIEMPGHASAALTAYPNLGCSKGPYAVQKSWGVFEDVFCAGNDSVFTFMEGVLEEVARIFPSRYIHIGGDECPKTKWKTCTQCQQRIKNENLKNEEELQSYFIKRIEKILNKAGKQMIGWDEILEGGLAPNAVVMSWRGEKGGIEAANEKHYVIMTPGSHCYFDKSQNQPEDSLTIGGYIPLEKVYNYEPIPAALSKDNVGYILGAQGNIWTEYIPNTSKLEYQAFPRMAALAEVLWTNPKSKSWENFQQKLPDLTKRYRLWGVNYCKPKPK